MGREGGPRARAKALARELGRYGVGSPPARQRLALARGAGAGAAPRRSVRDAPVARGARWIRPAGDSAPARPAPGLSLLLATHPAEYATDVLFTSRTALHALYARLLRHATLCLRAEDVLTFLGRKLHGRFAGELLNDCKRRWSGARVKHWMKASWSTMYDKHGCVLRVETVINEPYEFKVRRRAGRRGRRTLGWHPSPKGVAYLPRMLPCRRQPTTATSMLSRWSTRRPRTLLSSASCSRCGIPTGGRPARSTRRPPLTSPCSPPSSAASTRCRASETARCARSFSVPPPLIVGGTRRCPAS